MKLRATNLKAVSTRIATPIAVLLLLAFGATLAILLSQRDDQQGRVSIHGTAPAYESVEVLAESADLVVVGSVAGVIHRQVEETSDIPFAYVEIAVERTLVDRFENGDRTAIVVSIPDTDKVVVEGLTPLSPGERVVLFLERIRADEAPDGLIPFEEVFVPLSDDNGVFDVLGTGEVVARSDTVLSYTTSGIETARAARPEPITDENGQEVGQAELAPLRFELDRLVLDSESLEGG